MRRNALQIHKIFNLSNGNTVIACSKPSYEVSWNNHKAKILSLDGSKYQDIIVTGMREMSRQADNFDKIAIETEVRVNIKSEEVERGEWFIIP